MLDKKSKEYKLIYAIFDMFDEYEISFKYDIYFIKHRNKKFEAAYLKSDKKNNITYVIIDDDDFLEYFAWYINNIDGIRVGFLVTGNTLFEIEIDDNIDINDIINNLNKDDLIREYRINSNAKKYNLI